MSKIRNIGKQREWEEWLEFCRTYLVRGGLANEVIIQSIAGNLWVVVGKLRSNDKRKYIQGLYVKKRQ